MDLLARREHSKAELLRKLVSKDFAIDEAKLVIDELALEGLQSDARFVDAYVHMRIGRGYGPIRIQMELQERGIAPELIKHALDFDEEYWLDLANKTRTKKFGTKIPQDFAAKTKQMRYLQYKGFDNDVILRFS